MTLIHRIRLSPAVEPVLIIRQALLSVVPRLSPLGVCRSGAITSGRTVPMWQVMMDIVFLWCEKNKKLISHRTVTKLKRKVAGIEQFDQQPIKVFTKEAGWLRKEPDF